jgi:hypothetical protein
VLRKLTERGFTVNASKCHFCRTDISFLGHVISEKGGVAPCPQRTEDILSYPQPKKQKHLRQFLGVCICYQRFIIGYDDFSAPLLALLKKERSGSGL